MKDSTYTTATTNANEAMPTVLELQRVFDAIKALPEEPFRTYMLREGHDPDLGWVLVMPMKFQDAAGPLGVPDYVKFSRLIDRPVFMRSTVSSLKQYLREVR